MMNFVRLLVPGRMKGCCVAVILLHQGFRTAAAHWLGVVDGTRRPAEGLVELCMTPSPITARPLLSISSKQSSTYCVPQPLARAQYQLVP
jgi:hypothetical protein